MTRNRALVAGIAAMAAVVVASNILVQHPVQGTLFGVDLSSLLTWGAFTYPFAFLVNEMTNRTFGPQAARRVVYSGFVVAIVASAWLATPRIAIASGMAFLASQLLDVAVFSRLRFGPWWRAPLGASVLASALDTVVFFAIAFTALIPFGLDAFATESQPLLTVLPIEAPRWLTWAIADFTVKLLVDAFALAPYRAFLARTAPAR